MKRKIIICILLLFSAFHKMYCQVEEMIIPSDFKQQTIITEPPTLRKGIFRAGFGTNFYMLDKIFNETGHKEYILGTNGYSKTWTYVPGIEYGINDRLQVSFRMPYENIRNYVSTRISFPFMDFDTVYSAINRNNGIGDLEFGFRYQILSESSSLPSVTLGLYGIFPTGQKNPTHIKNNVEFDPPTGNGNMSLSADLFFKKTIYPYSMLLNTTFNYHFKGEKIMFPNEDAIEFKRGNFFNIYGGFGLHLNDWIALVNYVSVYFFEGNKYYYLEPEIEKGGYNLSYQPAIYFQVRRLRFFEVIQIPFAGKNSSADPLYSINLQYKF